MNAVSGSGFRVPGLRGMACCILLMATFASATHAAGGAFDRRWVHVSETSAVLCWAVGDIGRAARSYVEYGTPPRKTPVTREARWLQWHRLTGIETGKACSYRMVNVDPKTGAETRSQPLELTPRRNAKAIRIPEQVKGPPFVLDKAGATYVLTADVRAKGTAFEITAPDVILELDGHTIVFGDDTAEQVRGVWAHNPGKATICNGHIVQGKRSKAYSTAVESRWREAPTEIFGISTDVHLKCAYPVKFLGKATDVSIHHNRLYSRVVDIESRHYPGNDLLRLDISGGTIRVHDNLLTEGCHVGIRLAGKDGEADVHHNDIRHHQQYVNGYAIAASCAGAEIHHNRITSCGRGVHLTQEGIRLHHNYLDLRGHQHLDDIPAKSRPFKHQRVELHGIKFEGTRVKGCIVHDNLVRIVQHQPVDAGGKGAPEDKVATGVYVRGKPTAIRPDALVDSTQRWEKDRWRGYFARYAPDLPPARITGNDATTLSGEFRAAASEEYTIYQKWEYVPATPLNVACYDPNAMNEVRDNTFVALTTYRKTRHGGYGNSGQWAAALYLVGMDKGPARPDGYSIWIHGNRFVSNDLFVGATRPVNMAVRLEGNRFELASKPPPTEGRKPFWRIGPQLEQRIKGGGNTLQAAAP